MSQENKLVAEFPKSDIEVVRICLTKYKGKDFFDLRLYYRDDEGEWKPTKKGICLSQGLFPELKQAILTLEKALINQKRE